jgi:sugar phosphate isomerase/epimerase
MLPHYDPAATVEALARHGYDGVDWRVVPFDPLRTKEAPSFWGNNLSSLDLNHIEAEAEKVLPLCRAVGLEVTGLNTYLSLDSMKMGELESVMRAAKLLDCSLIRVNAPRYDGKTPFATLMKDGQARLQEVQKLAAGHGVKVHIEIHMGTIACSPSLMRQLVGGCDPRHIGVIFEPANMVNEGMENLSLSLEILGPYFSCLHVKNMAWLRDPSGVWSCKMVPLQEGAVNWGEVMGLIKRVGFDGVISFEDFSDGDRETDLRVNLAYIKGLLGLKGVGI